MLVAPTSGLTCAALGAAGPGSSVVGDGLHLSAQGQRFVGQHLPAVTGAVLQRWTGIMTFSCDLLPILGPIPGRPRFILCTGFNGCSCTQVEGTKKYLVPNKPESVRATEAFPFGIRIFWDSDCLLAIFRDT